MCEPWPGPRCNDKTKDRDVKLAQFKETLKHYSPESTEYSISLSQLVAAQHIYDTTPKGISELEEEFNKIHKKFNPALTSRTIRAKTSRAFQVHALEEIRNGRVTNLAKIASIYETVFTKQEIETILTCAREAVEESAIRKAIRKGNNSDISMNHNGLEEIVSTPNLPADDEYKQFLNNLQETLARIKPTAEVKEAFETLTKLPAPTAVNMKVYTSLGNALEYSKKQLAEELGRIAAIQDVSLKTAAEYYEAYKDQYTQSFSHLPLDSQPMPPKTWIEGELNENGITKTPSTMFIPRTPASLYAIYRLRVDLTAIPDYLKQSSKIIAIYPKGEGFLAKHLSRTGKQLGKEIHPNIHSLLSLVKNPAENSVIMTLFEPEGPLAEYVKEGKIISIPDFVSKHFDLPNKEAKFIADYFKTEEDPIALYSTIRKKILKTWSSNQTRSHIPKLAFSPTGDSAYVSLVR